MDYRPIAIVTDGMWRKSLSAIRSLGKAGYGVHVLGDTCLTVGFWSRFTTQRIRTADPKEDIAAFGRMLLQHLQQLRAPSNAAKPILLPMEDETLEYVVDNVDVLRAYADFLVPGSAALEICANKAATMALAARLNIPHPHTEVADTPAQLVNAAARMSGTEFITKPVRGSGSRGVRYNPTFNMSEANSYLRVFGTVLVQERLPPNGEARGVSLLFGHDGDCLAHFCHKRLHQFPNSGGPSTDRIGIRDEPLLDMSLRLLKELDWRGVAMVEWKMDSRNGKFMLLEINPRFWGSLELAVRSGVDFPLLYAQAAAGRVVKRPEPVTGIRCRWLLPGDILRWLTADKKEREGLGAFCKGLPWLAEEWDSKDLPGFFSCILCQGLAVLTPKYRKFLHR